MNLKYRIAGDNMNTENLMNLTLTHGPHDTPEDGMCLMEAVAFMGGEEHSDEPVCACPVIAAYARTLNDQMGEGAEGDALRAKHLLPIAQKLIGTRSTPEVEQKRMYFFADRAVRLFAPKALEAVGLTERADALRAVPEIVDEQTARAAYAAAYAAASAASAAYAAASAAAYAAARAASAAHAARHAAARASARASAAAYAAAYVASAAHAARHAAANAAARATDAARAAASAAEAAAYVADAANAADVAAYAAWAAAANADADASADAAAARAAWAAAANADADASADAAAARAATWAQAAQILAEACEINLEGGE